MDYLKGGHMMIKNMIITISREYGSGGRQVGEKLAETLGIPFYDNELISLAAEKSGLSKDYFKDSEEATVGNILLSLSTLVSSTEVYGLPLNEKVFLVQSTVIKELAAKGPFVIVGRCADYILQEYDNCMNVFIHADIEDRVARAVNEYGVSQKNTQNIILKTDKRRASYYSYFTNRKWGKASNYELVISTSKIGIDHVVEVIKNYATLREESK